MENPFKKMFGKKKEEDLSYRSGLTQEQRDRFGLDAQLKQPSEEDMEKLFPSDDLKRAFDGMKARTFPPVHAINTKRAVVLESLKRELISKENLETGLVVYIGSGDDIEYPILLGARDITLVDPGFGSEKEFKLEIIKKIKEIVRDQEIRIDGNEIVFTIDVGKNQKENITIRLENKYLTGGPHIAGSDSFNPSEKISLLLSFSSGVEVDQDGLLEKIPSGGYVLPDRMNKDENQMRDLGFDVINYQNEEIKGWKLFVKK